MILDDLSKVASLSLNAVEDVDVLQEKLGEKDMEIAVLRAQLSRADDRVASLTKQATLFEESILKSQEVCDKLCKYRLREVSVSRNEARTHLHLFRLRAC
jgi:hypothetical protein